MNTSMNSLNNLYCQFKNIIIIYNTRTAFLSGRNTCNMPISKEENLQWKNLEYVNNFLKHLQVLNNFTKSLFLLPTTYYFSIERTVWFVDALLTIYWLNSLNSVNTIRKSRTEDISKDVDQMKHEGIIYQYLLFDSSHCRCTSGICCVTISYFVAYKWSVLNYQNFQFYSG